MATVQLFDNDSDRRLGTIDEGDLQFLIDNLVEESSDDRDYFLRPETLDMLEERGASADLMKVLRAAIDGKKGVEVRWQRDER